MKVTPALFNTPMVQALLEGRKMQTRRVVKLHESGYYHEAHINILKEQKTVASSFCPFGKTGDLLYVRETTSADYESCDSVLLSKYTADNTPVLYSGCEDIEYNGSQAHWDYKSKSRPSIHMPRWASRLTLEITDIRVERLQDISEEDAVAEGLESFYDSGHLLYKDYLGRHHGLHSPIFAYKSLWESINGFDSWQDNPWLWVIEFKVHKMNVDEFLKEAKANE